MPLAFREWRSCVVVLVTHPRGRGRRGHFCAPGALNLQAELNLTLLRQRRATNDYGLALEIVRWSVEVAM